MAGDRHGDRIIELDETHSEDVALFFAQAFQDDPVLVHACPDAGNRARWLPWLFRWSTWQGLRFGHLLGTAGALDGAAAFVRPGGGPFSDDDYANRLRFDEAQTACGQTFWERCDTLVSGARQPHRAL
jgi:hypothetical protein